MPYLIGDALVLVLSPGVTLRTWRDRGVLEREWSLYRDLLPHYAQLIVVSTGGRDEEDLLLSLVPGPYAARVKAVCDRDGAGSAVFARAVPAMVAGLLAQATHVLVKTDQMMSGAMAVSITDALRGRGKKVGLLARGGYLWTRFIAHEQGPHSQAAEASGQEERDLCQAADMVAGTTQRMVDDLAWRYNLDPARTVAIPNFVLIEHPGLSVTQREERLVLSAGALVARKRVKMLIDAAVALREIDSKARLEIIGEGPLKAELESYAKDHDAPVSFLGQIPHGQLLKRMSECQVYVQCSELEGHPKTVIEAMSCGAAVVVTDSPGQGGLIQHGVTGLRCQADPRELARIVAELLNDEDWRVVMGSSAQRITQSACGLPAILEQELEVQRRTLRYGQSRHAGDVSAIRLRASA
jgi:glycosyltransferase involved in cell wall biosynthesis